MGDSKVTASAKTKRWKQRMTLLQNALLAREAQQRSGEALDRIVRQLFEEEAESECGDSSPTSDTAPLSARAPEALTGDAFAKIVLKHWSEANTDDKREKVHELVAKAFDTKTITEAERDALNEQLQ